MFLASFRSQIHASNIEFYLFYARLDRLSRNSFTSITWLKENCIYFTFATYCFCNTSRNRCRKLSYWSIQQSTLHDLRKITILRILFFQVYLIFIVTYRYFLAIDSKLRSPLQYDPSWSNVDLTDLLGKLKSVKK